jgi:twitching motility protein PilT
VFVTLLEIQEVGIMNDIIIEFKNVLTKARDLHASDIHLCVGTPWKYRLNGQIVPIKNLPLLKPSDTEAIVRHIVLLSRNVLGQDMDEFIQYLRAFDCSYSLPGVSRFRVNICRQRGTFSIVLRVIPFEMPTIDKLGLPSMIKNISMEERGLILITGITGSGKSTTLAAMINHINNNRPCKIITIEDPIEYLHKEIKASIIQREVGVDTESFSRALRASLRQDPDIILVGEMRDRSTIEIALKAAETGHLVLSTLHTLDAPRSIQRIISVFDLSEQKILRERLAATIKSIVSQRLLRRSDKKGRIAVFEIMRATLTIQTCIKDEKKTVNIRDLIASGRDQYGMQTFDQHLMDLYNSKIIDLATAKSAASSAADFERDVQFV